MHRGRKVLLYELNEVPWVVVDRYVRQRPRAALAGFLAEAVCRTTIDEDPAHLQPWRTWPTFHTSLHTDEHRSYDLGQDPSTFAGTPLWDVADAAGLRVGLFGVLQTWPPRRFRSGGFYVPDTFAATPSTEPASLERFQAFNLAMTRRNGFAPDAPFPLAMTARAAVDLARLGVTLRSTATIARHLVDEVRDRRYRSGRPLMQAVAGFDLFWRLEQRHQPHLGIFFTNHVAGVLHRFWGDAMPDDQVGHHYAPDAVNRRLVLQAMDIFDVHLRRIERLRRSDPDLVVIVASSMGQAAIEHREMPRTYVVTDPEQLVKRLHIDGAEPALAMYPRTSLHLGSPTGAERAAATLAAVRTDLGPLFMDIRVVGRSLTFEVDYRFDAEALPHEAFVGPGPGPAVVDVRELGIEIRERPGGGNTAFHSPAGILAAAGGGLAPDSSRREVDILDAAPSILDLLGLEPAASMRGHPTALVQG